MTRNFKLEILTYLRELRQEAVANKDAFRAKAYGTVLSQLDSVDRIESMEDLKDVKGIGKSIREKIEGIFSNNILVNTSKVVKHEVIQELTGIMGIGPVKADELVNKHNIKSIDDLHNNVHLLNDKQKLGLKYHKDILQRIPRKEMDIHQTFISNAVQKLSSCASFEIAGSYRRGLESSGDIDVLITHPKNPEFLGDLIAELKKNKYLCADFAQGSQKYMGVCKLPKHKINRRIDILVIPCDRFAFALLYFTGSQKFNIRMRQHALTKGYSLNEHGIKKISTDKEVKGDFSTERDIFKFIDFPYVPPTSRS